MYEVRDGKIVSPGKFEGEPEWVPVFWELGLDGQADQDLGHEFVFEITEEDYEDYPELSGYKYLILQEDELGFVRSQLTNDLPLLEEEELK